MGVERIGENSAEADAELLAMTVECLLKAGLKEFQVSVGQVDYFYFFLMEANLDFMKKKKISVPLDLPEKLFFGVEESLRSQNIPNYAKNFL